MDEQISRAAVVAAIEGTPFGPSAMHTVSNILAAINALPASGWQPIETAPRNIEFRCLLGHRYSVVTGYWDGDKWINERSAFGGSFMPTHWMPLPSAPVEPPSKA